MTQAQRIVELEQQLQATQTNFNYMFIGYAVMFAIFIIFAVVLLCIVKPFKLWKGEKSLKRQLFGLWSQRSAIV